MIEMIVNKETGEVVEQPSETNIDDLIIQWRQLKEKEEKIAEQRSQVEYQLSEMAKSIQGESKTKRVSGKFMTVKVVFNQKTKWDQNKLLSIREKVGEEIFDKYFVISGYKPKTTALKKLSNTAGEPEKLYHEFVNAMEKIDTKPLITVEES